MDITETKTRIERPFKSHKVSTQLKYKVLSGSLCPISKKPTFENFDVHLIMHIMSYLNSTSKIAMSYVSPKIPILPNPIDFRKNEATKQIQSLCINHKERKIRYQVNPKKRTTSLLQKGLFKYAFRIAHTIKGNKKNTMLLTIAMVLFTADPSQIDTSVKIINTIKNNQRYDALRTLAIELVKTVPSEVDKAVKIANTIEVNQRNDTLRTIAIELVKADPSQVDKAVEIANTINNYKRDDALRTLAIELVKADPSQVDKAIKIVKTSKQGYQRDAALKTIKSKFGVPDPTV
jgi:hypothetical protein